MLKGQLVQMEYIIEMHTTVTFAGHFAVCKIHDIGC